MSLNKIKKDTSQTHKIYFVLAIFNLNLFFKKVNLRCSVKETNLSSNCANFIRIKSVIILKPFLTFVIISCVFN